MNAFISILVGDDIVDIPGGERFREANVRYVNTEVFSGTNGDVAYASKIHDRFVGLFLDRDRVTCSARWTFADVVYGNNAEQIFFSESQMWYRVRGRWYRSTIDIVPVVVTASLLLLDNVTANLSSTIVARWTPR